MRIRPPQSRAGTHEHAVFRQAAAPATWCRESVWWRSHCRLSKRLIQCDPRHKPHSKKSGDGLIFRTLEKGVPFLSDSGEALRSSLPSLRRAHPGPRSHGRACRRSPLVELPRQRPERASYPHHTPSAPFSALGGDRPARPTASRQPFRYQSGPPQSNRSGPRPMKSSCSTVHGCNSRSRRNSDAAAHPLDRVTPGNSAMPRPDSANVITETSWPVPYRAIGLLSSDLRGMYGKEPDAKSAYRAQRHSQSQRT